MTTTTTPDADADRALKARHRAMWALGDYPAVVHDLVGPLGPRLVEAAGAPELCLSDEQVADVVRLGARAAAHFGGPQDIEWAYAQGRLHVLQSRPITTLFPLPDHSPTPASPLTVWFSFGAVQGLLDPLTPLGQDAVRQIAAGASRLFGPPIEPDVNPYLRAAGERLASSVFTSSCLVDAAGGRGDTRRFPIGLEALIGA